MTADLRGDMFGRYSRTNIQTPNIDKLAAQGVQDRMVCLVQKENMPMKLFCCLVSLSLFIAGLLNAQDVTGKTEIVSGGNEVKLFPGEKSDFRGYERYDRIPTAMGHFSIVCPKNPAPGNPWLWRSLFWDAVDLFRDADLKLVDEGYYVVLAHGDVAGHPSGNANIDAAYEMVTEQFGFAKTCSMASMSRGTLSLFRWATENPEKVNSIYVDNGVCNVLSWPAGKLVPGNASIASGAPSSWEGFKKKFGYATDEEALKTKESPIDLLEPLAKAGVPILMVCGSKDTAVPYEENDAIMEQRYKALSGDISVIIEDKGHTHGMKDPSPVLEFIRKHTSISPD